MNFVEMMTEKDSLTENGAVTNSTSHNFNLDLFFIAGACRKESVENIEKILCKSYNYDRVKTLKIMFWASDIRQGAGERRFFKTALNWLYKNHREDFYSYLSYVPEFSRWDVLFDIDDDKVYDYLIENINAGNALLCKWLPRKVKATDKKKVTGKDCVTITKVKRSLHNGIAGKLMKRMGLSSKQWRQLLVKNTNVVEQKMCSKQWNNIEYSKVPSVAINKYNQAWYRNDKERFEQYLEDVKSGKSSINASVIFPSDIIKSYFKDREWNEAKTTQWNALPNYLSGVNEIIPVCDVSGSMMGMPMNISVGLGLYISERNIGPFKDAFITFSGNPTMQVLNGSIQDRLTQLLDSDWGMNTDISAVFKLILNKAQSVNLPQEQMPKTILIISDMEFDHCGEMTNFDNIRQMYKESNYELPNIAFWNVNGRVGNVPVTVNTKGVALISGASPSIIKSVLGNELSPERIMNSVIETERYSFVK